MFKKTKFNSLSTAMPNDQPISTANERTQQKHSPVMSKQEIMQSSSDMAAPRTFNCMTGTLDAEMPPYQRNQGHPEIKSRGLKC